jgi:hypothetical protein
MTEFAASGEEATVGTTIVIVSIATVAVATINTKDETVGCVLTTFPDTQAAELRSRGC